MAGVREVEPDWVSENPVTGERGIVLEAPQGNTERRLAVEMHVRPGGGVVGEHLHPAIHERFEVLDGEAQFLSGRTWETAGAGQTVDVPAGVRHAYRNRSRTVAHLRCDARPPHLLAEFLTDVAGLSRAGKLVTRWAVPKGLSGILQGAVLAHHYREMAVLLFPPLPPPFLQRLLVPPLARLGERRGYRAGSFAALPAA